MKTFITLSICGLAAFAASGLWGQVFDGEEERLGIAVSVEPDKKPQPRRREAKVTAGPRAGYGGEGRGEYGGGYGGGMGGGYGAFPDLPKKAVQLRFTNDQLHAMREAAKALSEAEDDDARDEAQETLSELLDEYFEQDMNRREEELAAVEKRVKQLRELLERRREKKDDIINLQIDVLRNEADGLGFFSGESAGGLQNPYSIWFNPQPVPSAGLPPGHPAVAAPPATPAAPAIGPVVVPAPAEARPR